MRVTWFQERFRKDNQPASILDLCCGGGDMTFRFARAFSHSRIIAVDDTDWNFRIKNGMLQFVEPLLQGAQSFFTSCNKASSRLTYSIWRSPVCMEVIYYFDTILPGLFIITQENNVSYDNSTFRGCQQLQK